MQSMQSLVLLVSLSCFLTGATGAVNTAASPERSWEGGDSVGMLEPTHRQIQMEVDSGLIVAVEQLVEQLVEKFGEQARTAQQTARPIQESVWSTVVRVEDADWIRLEFGQIDLASATKNHRESYIRVTSLEDGYEHYLDSEALRVWGNTSAYMNGNAVRIELMASPSSTRADRVVLSGVQASAPVVGPASICGPVDDRVPSSDPRDARLMPIGCSAWLFSEHGNTFLTAGHCNPSGGNVVQFNVPLSSSGGGYRNPPPQDQYVIDGASVQRNAGAFSLGNDWGFFGAFDNSGTGLSPLAAQGDAHILATSPIASDGRPIRITGYGVVSSPVSATWNGVQKTHVGPFRGYSGNVVRYTTDTTGGNSGSVILDENNNQAIGIHTNAGCSAGGGWNNGCSLFNAGLQNALANPIGIAAPRNIQAQPSSAPEFVSPGGGDAVQLVITNLRDRTIAGSPRLMLDTGSGYQVSPMTMIDSTTFESLLPEVDCGTRLRYYFEITDTIGETTQYPDGGASSTLATIALDDYTLAFGDDFETDTGWAISNLGVSNGGWRRSTPISMTANGGAPVDADGSGKCFVTGIGVFDDLDGGTTQLFMPLQDVTGINQASVSFWAWVNTSDDELMTVEFSSDFGINWVLVDEIADTNGWEMKQYLIADYAASSAVFTVRVSLSDDGVDSLVEGGIDGFRIASQICNSACPADINGDGIVSFLDVSAFVSAFGNQDSAADINGDGIISFLDVSAFVSAFSAGCP